MSVSDTRVYALREVVEGAESADSIIDRASLFSAARILLKDICEDQHSHSYICEKAYKVGVHLSASLSMGDSHGLSLNWLAWSPRLLALSLLPDKCTALGS